MAVLEADPERGLSFLPLAARCGRTLGTIALSPGGDFLFKPQQRPRGYMSWLFNLLRPPRSQQIPAHQLLGARLESPYTFSVWYAVEHVAKAGCVERIKYKACKTRRFHTTDATATATLVEHLRRCSSWWGRSTPPHIAAIVNPVSGRGAAVRRFDSEVLPLLRDVAGLKVSVHRTRAPMHAAQLMREMNLRSAAGGFGGGDGGAVQEKVAVAAAAAESSLGAAQQQQRQDQQQRQKLKVEEEEEPVDLVLFVGGDGTLYEGLQGLFQRPDWDAARRTPLAAVPCGSGNGLAASAGLWDPVTAAVSACRGRFHPIDVASVLQPPGNRSYCILSMVYGAMANLDVGTNHLRWMGELRFHLGGLMELIRGRLYSCRVFVLPPSDADPASATPPPHAAVGRPANGSPFANDSCNGSGATSAAGDAAGQPPGATVVAAAAAATLAPAPGGVDPGLGVGVAALETVTSGNLDEPLLPGRCAAQPCKRLLDGAGLKLGDYPKGPSLPLLSQLPSLPHPLPDHPRDLPDGWVQLADTFAILGAYNVPYIALGAKANPGGSMSDGAWDVWHLDAKGPTVKTDSTGAETGRGKGGKRADRSIRMRALKVLLGIEDGSFAKSEGVMGVIKARALMFEQRDTSTWTVLDGEEAPDAPIYLEVHPGLCSVLVSPRHREEDPL